MISSWYAWLPDLSLSSINSNIYPQIYRVYVIWGRQWVVCMPPLLTMLALQGVCSSRYDIGFRLLILRDSIRRVHHLPDSHGASWTRSFPLIRRYHGVCSYAYYKFVLHRSVSVSFRNLHCLEKICSHDCMAALEGRKSS